MANFPHFDLPFRFGVGGHAAVVEQDSDDDITNCVQATVRTQIGTRLYVPKFGISDPTFKEMPLDVNAIQQQIHDSEPRAGLVVQQEISDLVSTLDIGVGGR